MSIEDVEIIDSYIPSEELQIKISKEIGKLNLEKGDILWLDDFADSINVKEYEVSYVLDKDSYFKRRSSALPFGRSRKSYEKIK